MERKWTGGGASPTLSSTSYNLAPLKDMVIFEERIRQNIDNLQRIRQRLRIRIVLLSCAIIVLIFLHAKFVKIVSIFSSPSFLAVVGLLLLYAALLAITIFLGLSLREWRNSLVKRYEEQCTKVLRQFNLQLTHRKEKELTFVKRLPKRLADLFNAYRREYRARRALRSNLGLPRSQ